MRIVLCILLVCTIGCSTTKRRTERQAKTAVQLELVESLSDRTRDAIERSPLTFYVPISEERYAWERARIFLDQYAHGARELIQADRSTLLSHAHATLPCRYRVRKTRAKDGYDYDIGCQAGVAAHSPQTISLAAHNLARFIRTGEMEMPVVTRASGSRPN